MRRTRQGEPAATALAGMLRLRTEPAPITVPSPTSTPSRMIVPIPIRQRLPIRIGPEVQRVWGAGRLLALGRPGSERYLVFAAATDLAAATHDHGVTDEETALGVQDSAHPDVAVVADTHRPDLGLDRDVAAQDGTGADPHTLLARAAAVDDAAIVEHGILAEADALRVAQGEVAPEHDPARAGLEQAREGELAQGQAQGSRDAAEQHRDELIAGELPHARFHADHEVGVAADQGSLAGEELGTDVAGLFELGPAGAVHAGCRLLWLRGHFSSHYPACRPSDKRASREPTPRSGTSPAR